MHTLQQLVDDVHAHAAMLNHVDEVEAFDPDGEHVNIAGTARVYRDAVREAFHTTTKDDGPIHYRLGRWNHRLQMVSVYAADEYDEFTDAELRPGEVVSFLLANDKDLDVVGPYDTDEENLEFFEAQKGGWTSDMFGEYTSDDWDDHDTRQPEGWAEYLEPKGLVEFYDSDEWNWLRAAMKWAIAEADRKIARFRKGDFTEGFAPDMKWEWIKVQVREPMEAAFSAATALYLDQSINITAMALLVHKFVSPTRFSRWEMAEMTEVIPAISHVDQAQLGYSLLEWMKDHAGEIDEILEDGADYDTFPRFPNEEVEVATKWVNFFEERLEYHWTQQARARTPALQENGQKLWASCFTGMGDVAYNMAYFRAVCAEAPINDAITAGKLAREDLRGSRQWTQNDVVVSADDAGLVMGNRAIIAWVAAADRITRLKVEEDRRPGLLAQLRTIYTRSNGDRPHIAIVGQAIKEMSS